MNAVVEILTCKGMYVDIWKHSVDYVNTFEGLTTNCLKLVVIKLWLY